MDTVSFRAFINTTGVGTRDTQVTTSHHQIELPDSGSLAGNATVLATADWFRDLLTGILLPSSVLMKIVATHERDDSNNDAPKGRSRKFEYEAVGTRTPAGINTASANAAANYVRVMVRKRTGDGRDGALYLSGAVAMRELTGNGKDFNVIADTADAINDAITAAGAPPAPDVLLQKEGSLPIPVVGYEFGGVVDRDTTRRRIPYAQAQKNLAKRRVYELERAAAILNPTELAVADLPSGTQSALQAIKTEVLSLVAEYGPSLIKFITTNARLWIRYYWGF